MPVVSRRSNAARALGSWWHFLWHCMPAVQLPVTLPAKRLVTGAEIAEQGDANPGDASARDTLRKNKE